LDFKPLVQSLTQRISVLLDLYALVWREVC
jgi:hypothetical protein